LNIQEWVICLQGFSVEHVEFYHDDDHYRATSPLSTVIICPTTNEALSEHSQMTASATSSGLPVRPIGCHLVRWNWQYQQ